MRPQTDERTAAESRTLSVMPSIPELVSGHATLEVESLDRLYLNGYIGPLATQVGS